MYFKLWEIYNVGFWDSVFVQVYIKNKFDF